MPTPRENFLRLVNNDNPRWLGDPFNCFNIPAGSGPPYILDATAHAHGRTTKGGVDVPDAWGVIWDWPDDQPGPTPNNHGDKKVVKDITRWREFFDFPSLDNLDWTDTHKIADSVDRENKLVMAQSPRGMFEFSHALMGFEDALENFLLEPDDMYEMLSAYTDWKIKAAGLCIDNLKPDIITNFDDWGSKTQLFLPPRVWREILKPLYERFFGYIKSRGVITMNHCDCHAEDICVDMVEAGLDVWQGVTPENNFPAIVEKTEGKLLLFGGLDMPSIDYPGVTEEAIRAHIREALDKYAPTKRYLPIFSSWLPIFPGVKEIACDEMDKYGAVVAERVFG
ncbi:MAG: uroporphyrinogen decarboxylase (URO-D) [Oscillospiraceae bacterium]|nr:uroporphyrinogen decarboxylase (URO-D) [Oscillospiraceae bacterium]